ncbi:hypothetical protein ACWD4T_00765 [Streptomyces umbrinus]
MSIIVAVLLICTALAAAVTARIAFRLAIKDGGNHAIAWGAAGGAALATIIDVCTVAAALDIAHGQPTGARTAVTIVTSAVALVLAYAAYDLTGSTVAPPGTTLANGLTRPKRLASAASAFTGTFMILALIMPLLF